MAEFILLLRGGDFDGYSQEEMRVVSAKYLAWRKKAAGNVMVTSGAPLADGIKCLYGAAPHTKIIDGPFAETKEVIGGYYFVEANDENHALEFCRDNPHLEHGGTVEIREVIPISSVD
jgi:hypothetical protein